jgi:6-phosphogluconolactonase (cycloisomerase 2 family)
MARLTIHGTPGGAGRCGTSLVAHVAFSAVVGLCYQGCGATQENEVRPLTPTTFVYAFEPGLVYAYKIDASGQIAGVSGARFRIADREWERVVADPAGRFLFAIVGDPGEIWVYALDADTGAPDLVRGSPFVPRRPHVLRGAVVAPLNPVLYVVGEPGADLRGDVSAFRFDPVAGTLTELDASPFSTGFEPFRTWVDPEGPIGSRAWRPTRSIQRPAL